MFAALSNSRGKFTLSKPTLAKDILYSPVTGESGEVATVAVHI